MELFKNIKINNEIYQLELEPIIKRPTYSGKIYRLQIKDNLMAIKLYRTQKCDNYEIQDDWFPPLKDITKFIELSSQTFPLLLSNSIVLDENDKYIGCSSYYVSDSNDTSKMTIFDIPREQFFFDIFSLEEQLSICSNNHILINDLSIFNLKFGTITKNPNKERIYFFDDSNYRLADYNIKIIETENHEEFNEFGLNILEYYFDSNLYFKEQYAEFLYEVSRNKNVFSFIEKESRDYLTISDFLQDRVKRYLK